MSERSTRLCPHQCRPPHSIADWVFTKTQPFLLICASSEIMGWWTNGQGGELVMFGLIWPGLATWSNHWVDYNTNPVVWPNQTQHYQPSFLANQTQNYQHDYFASPVTWLMFSLTGHVEFGNIGLIYQPIFLTKIKPNISSPATCNIEFDRSRSWVCNVAGLVDSTLELPNC